MHNQWASLAVFEWGWGLYIVLLGYGRLIMMLLRILNLLPLFLHVVPRFLYRLSPSTGSVLKGAPHLQVLNLVSRWCSFRIFCRRDACFSSVLAIRLVFQSSTHYSDSFSPSPKHCTPNKSHKLHIFISCGRKPFLFPARFPPVCPYLYPIPITLI